ncbi:MAG: hypothetical protein MJE68_20210, partial [Proteobacteria bacterium]|nr:hypothetical protein [Pseudomonadota bacterium]
MHDTTISDLFRPGDIPPDWHFPPPPMKFAHYHNNTCNFCPIINLFACENSLRSHQKQSQRSYSSKFSWGSMPPDSPSLSILPHKTLTITNNTEIIETQKGEALIWQGSK